MAQTGEKPKVIPANFLPTFILVTFLFSLWGFANDITNPMVDAFKNILLLTNVKSALVQFAFYGGYCVMALPAALFIKRFSYKTGILLGLVLYATGCFLFIPSGYMMEFWAFLIAYFIMTCGLSFLETSANPYILSMGPEETSTRRLNFAQSFNPMGSLLGMLIAKEFILAKITKADEAVKTIANEIAPEKCADIAGNNFRAFRSIVNEASPAKYVEIQQGDLAHIIWPYLILGGVVFVVLVIFLVSKLAKCEGEDHKKIDFLGTFRRLVKNRKYVEGVIAQTFYVGAQIVCWTFIIQYADKELGMLRTTAQGYNMIAMIIFVSSRFIKKTR